MNQKNPIVIFSGAAHVALAEAVCADVHLGLPLGRARVGAFSDGETRVELHESVRGADAYVIQPTCTPVNQNVMELLIMIDALKRASAGSITAVLPYFGYARQDRKAAPRTPISSKLVVDLLEAAGVDRVVTVDLHAAQIQGFFGVPEDNLFATPVILPHLQAHYTDAVVVSPDAGGVERARAYAKRLGGDLAIIDKRRDRPNECAVMNVVGDVRGRRCVLLDDMIDTAGTLVGAAEALLARGATEVAAAATHGVFSGNAATTLRDSPLSEIIITDTIPLSADMRTLASPATWKGPMPRLTVLSVANLLADAIARIHSNESVSSLFV